MKKVALALALVVATGYVSNTVYATTSSTYTVVNNGDKDKDKKKSSNKKECEKKEAEKTAPATGKSCSSAGTTKSCCAAKKSQ